MKLSTKGRYGIKAMIYIGAFQINGPVAIKDIADTEMISEKYLEKIISLLKKDKLLKSIRGSQGGYMLAKNPNDIKVGDIIRTLEGSLAPVSCVDGNYDEYCKTEGICVTKHIWEEIKEAVDNILDSYSLSYLIEKYRMEEIQWIAFIWIMLKLQN